MKKPTKSSFGWTVNGRWATGNRDGYFNALKAWEGRKHGTGGRPRSPGRPIHESWQPYMELFDSSNPTRSQGAFCRFTGVERSVLSNALSNGMSDKWKGRIEVWVEHLEAEKEKANEQ